MLRENLRPASRALLSFKYELRQRKSFGKIDFHIAEAKFLSVFTAPGAPMTSNIIMAKIDGQLNLEVELMLAIQKKG